MDEIERLMTRERARWRAKQKGLFLDSLWGWEFWQSDSDENHHIAGRQYGDATISVPVNMHRELTRRQMEEHPPPGPDPTNPLEIAGRYNLGLADLFECIADCCRAIGLNLIAAAAKGKHKL